MKRVAAAFMLIAVALAGCAEPDVPTNPGTSMGFDGDATLALVEDIVYLEDGSLRPRHPQSDGHGDTAIWLQDQLTVDGWQATLDEFSGADYEVLDKGAVERYTSGRYCKEPDRGELSDLSFTNLYASLPGSSAGQVVLAAHWDAKEDAHGPDGPVPAANDGASGVAVLLELQRHIMDLNLTFPFDLTIALFDGEDGFEDCHPLAGSLWAARTGSLGDISQFILLDMVGDADARFIRDDASMESDPDLMDALWANGHEHGLGERFTDCEGPMLDDHIPFHEEGIDVIDIIDAGHGSEINCIGFQPYWHTSEDTPDKLSADMLGRMGDLMLWMLTDSETQALLQD